MMCNGLLAGLVAIGPGRALRRAAWAAVLIGAAAGVLVLVQRAASSETPAASTIRWARSPSTASTASGGCSRRGTLRQRQVWQRLERRRAQDLRQPLWLLNSVRGLLYGDISRLGAQVLGAAVVAACRFCLAALLFRLADASGRCGYRGKPRSKASIFPKSAPAAIPISPARAAAQKARPGEHATV